MNVVDAILHQCRINADCLAIVVPGTRLDRVTYSQVEYMINNLTRVLGGLEFQPGAIVGLLVEDKIFHIALMLALTRLGIINVSCRDPSLPKELSAHAVITDTMQPFQNVARIIRADQGWLQGDGKPIANERLKQTAFDDVFRIVLTSGSTGTSKAVAFTHRMLTERNARLEYAYGPRWPQCSRLYCDLGLSAGPSFRYVMYSLMRGGTILLHGNDVLETTMSFGLYKIQNMVTSPHGLEQHVKVYKTHTIFQCNFDHIVVAGGQLSKELADEARAYMSRHVISYYGATEAGSIASADSVTLTNVPGAVGYVLPGAEVEIVDGSERKISAGQEGILRVRTDNLADGYFDDPEMTKQSFRHGFFYPGDLGYLAEGGLLAITGRAQTRLNIGGDKVNPKSIEVVVSSFPGISDAAVFSVANELGVEEVYALIVQSGSVDERALRTHCASRLQSIFVPARFISIERIPRTETGKIERGKLRDAAKRQLA